MTKNKPEMTFEQANEDLNKEQDTSIKALNAFNCDIKFSLCCNCSRRNVCNMGDVKHQESMCVIIDCDFYEKERL